MLAILHYILIVKQIPSKVKTLAFEIFKKRLQAIKRGQNIFR